MTVLAVTLGLCWHAPVQAGAFVFADADEPDTVTHPQVYSGTGGTLADLTICIDISQEPALAAQAEGAVRKVVATHNRFMSLSANNRAYTDATDLPPGQIIDFETILLHEVGHCIGLDHPNHASESGLLEPARNGTKSLRGPNGVFDQNPGPDGLHGSRDDVRGDDVNLHWYVRGQNNPGVLPAIVDTSTMARELNALPAGHSFVANADIDVMNALGFPNTESVMQQGSRFAEAARHFQHDDLATLRLARTGLDRVAGTSDDYRYAMRYVGQLNNPSNSACNVRIRFQVGGFAVCSLSAQPITPNNWRIRQANIAFTRNADWYFSPGPNTVTTITADTPDPSPVGQPYTVSVTVREAAGITITGEPRGTVVVTDGAPAPNTATCTITLAGIANETGSCQLVSTVPGTRDLTADFVGFAGWDGSRGTAPHGTGAIDALFGNGFE